MVKLFICGNRCGGVPITVAWDDGSRHASTLTHVMLLRCSNHAYRYGSQQALRRLLGLWDDRLYRDAFCLDEGTGALPVMDYLRGDDVDYVFVDLIALSLAPLTSSTLLSPATPRESRTDIDLHPIRMDEDSTMKPTSDIQALTVGSTDGKWPGWK